MKPIVHLPPEARRRQGRGTVSLDPPDPHTTLRRLLAERMSDLTEVRQQFRSQCVQLAASWRREGIKQSSFGNGREEQFYAAAADALEGWASKVFSDTTVWPGL